MAKQDKKRKDFIFIIGRYVILLLLLLIITFSPFIYNLLLNTTLYSSNFLLNLFYNSYIYDYSIILNNHVIELIPACVGFSAYMLLLILNILTSMTAKKRIYSLIFSIVLLFIINVIRIVVFSVMFISNTNYFYLLHLIFWYILSIAIIVGAWFLTAHIFKIKEIPVYSDFKRIINIKRSKK